MEDLRIASEHHVIGRGLVVVVEARDPPYQAGELVMRKGELRRIKGVEGFRSMTSPPRSSRLVGLLLAEPQDTVVQDPRETQNDGDPIREAALPAEVTSPAAEPAGLPARPLVAIITDKHGDVSVMHTEGVDVVWVDETAPEDRVYLMDTKVTHARIAKVMGEDPVGTSDDHKQALLDEAMRQHEAGVPFEEAASLLRRKPN